MVINWLKPTRVSEIENKEKARDRQAYQWMDMVHIKVRRRGGELDQKLHYVSRMEANLESHA